MKTLRHVDIADAEPFPRGPGRRLPSTIAALDRRDELLRRAYVTFFADVSCSQAATALHAALAHYHATGWRIERSAERCPPRHVGRLAEFGWRCLRAHPAVPAARTIRRAIRGQRDAADCTTTNNQ